MAIDVVNIIQEVGFPIFIACWFMLRTEKVINNSNEIISNNTEMLGTIKEVIENCNSTAK